MMNRFFTSIALFIFIITPSLSQEISSGHNKQEILFHNDSIQIAATFYTPTNEKNYPAVVIVHGSGTSTRQNAWTTAYAKALIKRGVAVLYPDKRGSGASTGDWSKATFQDLAKDAVAGVNYLIEIPEIDKSKIGVIGFSQGGHVVPVAASLSEDISFVIDVSGSVVPMMEQIMDEVELMAEREGLNHSEVEKVNQLNRKAIFAALTSSNSKDYFEYLEELKQGPLKGREVVEGFPTDTNHVSKTFINTIGDFDPIPYWKKIAQPILFVYGGKDRNIKIKKSIDRIDASLGESNYDYTILYFRQNGHALYREDLMDFIPSWIDNIEPE